MPPAASPVRLNRLLVFIEHDASNLSLRNDAIREAFSIGHWDTARKLIDDGLRLYPQDAGLLAFSGFCHLQARHYNDAEEALSAAQALGLDAAEVHYNLAFAKFGQKRHEEALAMLTEQVSQAVPLALLLRARCLHHLNRRAEAAEMCRAHLAVTANDGETHGLLGLLLYEQGLADQAMPHVNAALEQNPQQLEAMLVSAAVQSDSKNYDTARALFDELLRLHPECGRAWHGLALIELTQLQMHAARRKIELATVHMPDHIGSWHVLAWVNIMLGDILSAELAFEKCLLVDRNFGETHGGLAVIAAIQGREAEARASIRRALRLDPHSMSAQYAQMVLLQRAGQHSKAQEILDAALARKPSPNSTQYRDLVAAQLEYVRSRQSAAEGSDPPILH